MMARLLTGNTTISGAWTFNGIPFDTHKHTGATPGSGVSGLPWLKNPVMVSHRIVLHITQGIGSFECICTGHRPLKFLSL